MKRSTPPKLALRAQTIRLLGHEALCAVAGGNPGPVANGILMKDSIIVRTGG